MLIRGYILEPICAHGELTGMIRLDLFLERIAERGACGGGSVGCQDHPQLVIVATAPREPSTTKFLFSPA